MEIAILILILALCLCLVYVTELMKRMCDRMNWLQDQFNNFKYYNNKEYVQFNKEFDDIEKQFTNIKDDNAKKWMEYSKEYSEVTELLLTKHNEINELRDQVKLIEDRVEKYKDGTCDNICTVYSRLQAMDDRVTKNEEDKTKGDEYRLYDEVYGLRARLDALDYMVKKNKEMSNKEEKEENE